MRIVIGGGHGRIALRLERLLSGSSPGRLTNDPGTGLVTIAESLARGEVPRDDVAAVLAAVLAREDTAGLTLELVAGDQPVEQAVAAIVEGRR